jgi:Flp pilus assembly protein TadB
LNLINREAELTPVKKAKPPNPWITGSFYAAVFLVVAVVLGHLPLIALPMVIIGGLLALSVIGAFQMRQDEKLSQENFLKLMALSLKYLPWITATLWTGEIASDGRRLA